MSVLLVIVVCIAILGFLVFVIVQESKPTVLQCPHCNCRREVHQFGNYRCTVCGAVFVADGSGKVVPSLVRVHAGPAAIGSALTVLLTLLSLREEHATRWWTPVCSVALLLCHIGAAIQRKRFPAT